MSDATIEPPEAKHATYSYGDSSRPGVLLGFPLRQVLPVGIGVLVATVGLMSGLVVLVIVGPVVGGGVRVRSVSVARRCTSSPGPASGLLARRGRATWTPVSLLAAGAGSRRERAHGAGWLVVGRDDVVVDAGAGGGGARQGVPDACRRRSRRRRTGSRCGRCPNRT